MMNEKGSMMKSRVCDCEDGFHCLLLRVYPVLIAGLLVMGWCRPALAHGLHVFATGDGNKVDGRAYFTLHSPVKFAHVELRTPDGKVEQTSKTDQDGRFSFTVTRKVPYKIVVRTCDGHQGEFTIDPEDLDLGAEPGQGQTAGTQPVQADHADHVVHAGQGDDIAPAAAGNEVASRKAIKRMFEKMLARQREQLDAFENRERLRDVLAGIGYILGLAGISFYFFGSRRKDKTL